MKIFYKAVFFILLIVAVYISYSKLPKLGQNKIAQVLSNTALSQQTINEIPAPRQRAGTQGRNDDSETLNDGSMNPNNKPVSQNDNKPKPIPSKMTLQSNYHVYETFNNCGPATLSMVLRYYDTKKSQKEIADIIRPYQHPRGDNDDKSISFSEFSDYIKQFDLVGVAKVNGDVNTLKKIIANNVPVVTHNWLNEKDTIGHFIIIKGYDDTKSQFILDDSYYGPNKTISYATLLKLWQPFNYEYFFITRPEKIDLAKEIVGEFDDKKLYEASITRADEESGLNHDSIYPYFNKSTAYYYLGDHQKSIENFEKIENKLPNRMLWYQIEPIQAYYELKNYDKALKLIDATLKKDNRAFSELYYIRGQIYEAQNKVDEARVEYKKALIYNKNYKLAQKALDRLNQ